MHLKNYILQLADTALIHSQRLGEWCGHAPELEIDIALSNIALDYIGASRSFYQYAAQIIGANTTEDTIAFLRNEREYKNILLVEITNGNFAKTIAKAFYLDNFMQLFYTALCKSTDETISAIAQKSLKEVNYHIRFSNDWVVRLGDGTEESKTKMQQALEEVWAYTGEMFIPNITDLEMVKSGIGVDVTLLKNTWLQNIKNTLSLANLQMPALDAWMHTGGKDGLHTEQMGFILSEMQYMQRAFPNANW